MNSSDKIMKEIVEIFEALWRAALMTLAWAALDYFFGEVQAESAYRTAFYASAATWYVFWGIKRDRMGL